jgi:hypothetical protein
LLAISIASLAAAQAQSGTVIKATIPFEFTFAQKTFPAGDYYFVQTRSFLMLRDSQGRTLGQALTQEIGANTLAAKPTLKFRSSDGAKALAEVWQRDSSGQKLLIGRSKGAQRQHINETETARNDGQL